MKPFHQLLRRPVHFLAVLILFAASSAFLCLGWGVLRSAQATSDEMDRRFVTLAQIAPQGPDTPQRISETLLWDQDLERVVRVEAIGDTGKTLDDLYDFIEKSGCLRGLYQTDKTSAYVPQLRIHMKLSDAIGHPSRTGASMFVFTLTEIGDIKDPKVLWSPDGQTAITHGGRRVTVKGKVDDCLALPKDYEAPSEIQVELSEKAADGKPIEDFISGLEIGKKYIVADYNAANWDLYARKSMLDMLAMRSEVAGNYTVDDINWDYLSWESRESMGGLCAVYSDPALGEYAMTSTAYLEKAGCYECSVTLEADTDKKDGRGAVSGISELTCPIDDFLADPDNRFYADFLESAETQQHCVSVMGTDMLQSFYLFHENLAFVTEGRYFSEQDYLEGRPVCLVSEALAVKNGLSVGDKLDMGFYQSQDTNLDSLGNLGHEIRDLDDEFDPEMFFAAFSAGGGDDHYGYAPAIWYAGDSQIQAEKEYEIIGIYRNTAQTDKTISYASASDYAAQSEDFSLNAIFVPNASLGDIETDAVSSRRRQKIVLKNGSTDRLDELLAAEGYPEGLLVYFDGGYSAIEGTLKALRGSAGEIFLAAAGTFLVILAAYIALFVAGQRRNAGLMLSLGAGRRKTSAFLLTVSLIPPVIGSVIGSAAGALLLGRVVEAVLGDVSSLTGGKFSGGVTLGNAEALVEAAIRPDSAFWAFAAMTGIYLIALTVAAVLTAGKKPRNFLRK